MVGERKIPNIPNSTFTEKEGEIGGVQLQKQPDVYETLNSVVSVGNEHPTTKTESFFSLRELSDACRFYYWSPPVHLPPLAAVAFGLT